MNIQPIVFATAPQPTGQPTGQPSGGNSNGGMLVMVGMNVVLLLVILFVALRPSQPGPGPSPDPGPSPQPVIAEVVEAAKESQRAESRNYAAAHRRLAEMVRDGAIKDQAQFKARSETLMRAARNESHKRILGPLDNRYLPETFSGAESLVLGYLDSLATGFDEASE